ncbi:MAG TPA: hypothetical protein VF928_08320 [Usitatibacteraceae bacterium]
MEKNGFEQLISSVHDMERHIVRKAWLEADTNKKRVESLPIGKIENLAELKRQTTPKTTLK